MKLNLFNTINLTIVSATVCLLAVLAFRVQTGNTADSVAVLKTSGMTCGGCADTITSALKKQSGVAVAEVDVANGLVVVGYDTKKVTPTDLEQTVSGSGYASSVARVMPPEEFRRLAGRNVGQEAGRGQGCCGGSTCGMKQKI